MEKELIEVIKANLPASTAGAMQEYITQAEVNKKRLAMEHKAIESLEKKLSQQSDEVSKLRDELSAYKDLEKRERAVAEQQRDLKLTEAVIRKEEAEKRSDCIMELVGKVFGHPAVSVSQSVSKPIMTDSATGMVPIQSGMSSEYIETTTKTVKE